jgi:hypothetical protein
MEKRKLNEAMMQPIFIGGCDRSGTTMLGAMLGTHSDILCVPESQFITDILRGANLDLGRVDLQALYPILSRHPRFKLWGIPLSLQDIDSGQPCSYAQAIQTVVRQYGQAYGKSSARFWVDHTPSNIKQARTLLQIFPQAKIIHIVRDGRAVTASFLRQRWGPKSADRVAYLWLQYLAFGLACEHAYGADRVNRIKYEDLVDSPEDSLRAICSFLEVDYQPGMDQGDGFNVPSFTLGSHALVGKAPERSRISAWKEQLTPRQIEIFESIAGEMLVYLGYESLYGANARLMTNTERIHAFFAYLFMLTGNIFNQLRLRWYDTNL